MANDPDDLAQRAEQIAADAPSGWAHTGPWVCAQRWEQLLFLHWPVPTAVARALVPAEIEIDTHGGQAYVSVLALRMAKVHLRDMVPIPGLADFPELNVRTYVVHDGKPGVWFVSLDAPSHLNVWIGRHMFHLNVRRRAHADDRHRRAHRLHVRTRAFDGPVRRHVRTEWTGGAGRCPGRWRSSWPSATACTRPTTRASCAGRTSSTARGCCSR